MSMQERPDDEAANEGLDRLFRKSAEEFEPPYEPVAWQLMSAKLDEHDRVTIWGRVLRGSLAIMAFIVLLSGSWYVYKQNLVKTPVAELVVTQSVSQPRAGVAPEGAHMPKQVSPGSVRPTDPGSTVGSGNSTAAPLEEPGSAQPGQLNTVLTTERTKGNSFSTPKNSVTKSVAPQPQQEIAGRHIDDQPMEIETSQRRRLSWPVVRQHSTSERARKRSSDPVSGLREPGVLGKPTSLKKDLTLFARTDSDLSGKKVERVVAVNRPTSEPTESTVEIPGNTPAIRTTADALVGDSATISSEQSRIGPLDALGSRDVMRWPQWSSLTIPALALPQSEPAAAKSAKPVREHGLSIRLVLSPDLSAVGTQNFTRPGRNYGLLLEYRISNRFSVQAGVIQSKKIYTATPEQYAWPTNWQWYVKPVGVDGRCSMLDIPINLRYDFLRIPTGSGRLPARWFVSSGVTTYIMQQETYDYIYADPTNQWIKNRSFSAKTGRYNFSNLNLSIGYERPIGKRFAWQIEPFVKAPLKEVGYFKINLLSTGAFLSLRYRL